MEPANGKQSLPRAGRDTETSSKLEEILSKSFELEETVGYCRTAAADWASIECSNLGIVTSKATGAECMFPPMHQLLNETTQKEETEVAPLGALRSSNPSKYLDCSNKREWSRCGIDSMSGRLEISRQSSSSGLPSPLSASERIHASSSISSDRSSSSHLGSSFQTLESICKLNSSNAAGSSASVSTTCSRERNRRHRSGSGSPERRTQSVPSNTISVNRRSRDMCGGLHWRGNPRGTVNSPSSNTCKGSKYSSNSIRMSVAEQCSGSETESFDSRSGGEIDNGERLAFACNRRVLVEDGSSNRERRSNHWAFLRAPRSCSSSHRRSATTSLYAHRITSVSSRTCAADSLPTQRRSRSTNKDSDSGGKSRQEEDFLSGSNDSVSGSRRQDCSSTPDKAMLSTSCCVSKALTLQKTELSVTATPRGEGYLTEDAAAAERASAGLAVAGADAAAADSGAGARAETAQAAGSEHVENATRASGQGRGGTNVGELIAGCRRAVGDALDTRLRSTLSVLALTCPVAFTHAVEEAASALATQQQLLVLRTAEALLQNFVESYETFIFDVDGVLLMGKRAFAGVAEGLAFLREKGKRLLFLTNSASKSRRMCVEVLRNAGIHAEFNEVVCSSYAAALHLQLRYPHVRKVFMIGEAGLEEELRTAGFKVVQAADIRTLHSHRTPRQAATFLLNSRQAAPFEAPCECSCTRKSVFMLNKGVNPVDVSQSGAASSRRLANVRWSSPAGNAGVSAASSAAAASLAVDPRIVQSQRLAASTGPYEGEHFCCNGAHSCAAVTAAHISGNLPQCSADQAVVTAAPAVETAASAVSSVSATRSSSEACAVCSGDRRRSKDVKEGAGGLSRPRTFSSCTARKSTDFSTLDRQQLYANCSPRAAPPLFPLIRETCVADASQLFSRPSVSTASSLRSVNSEFSSIAPAASIAAPNSDPAPAASRSSSSSPYSGFPRSLSPNASEANFLVSSSPYIVDEESFTSLARSLDPEVDAVVVGWDRRFDYFKLAVASLYLQREGSLPFLAANRDAFDVVAGLRMPANGAAVAALETAAGRTACCVGKPSAWLAETVLRFHAINAATTVVCGDRLDTDIAFGKFAGTRTCITLTGCTTLQQLLEMPASHPLRPDAVCPHVGLLCLLKSPRSTEGETAEQMGTELGVPVGQCEL